jgi:hypothetical protein
MLWNSNESQCYGIAQESVEMEKGGLVQTSNGIAQASRDMAKP